MINHDPGGVPRKHRVLAIVSLVLFVMAVKHGEPGGLFKILAGHSLPSVSKDNGTSEDNGISEGSGISEGLRRRITSEIYIGNILLAASLIVSVFGIAVSRGQVRLGFVLLLALQLSWTAYMFTWRNTPWNL